MFSFAKGGAWTKVAIPILNSLDATATSPIVFNAYSPSWGGAMRPWLRTNGGSGFQIGLFRNMAFRAGCTLRWPTAGRIGCSS